MYSIHGYDPCYFLDFNKNYTFKYKLICKLLDENGLVDVKPESTGIKYIDIKIPPNIS